MVKAYYRDVVIYFGDCIVAYFLDEEPYFWRCGGIIGDVRIYFGDVVAYFAYFVAYF